MLKPLVIRVPAQPEATLAEICDRLNFDPRGKWVAEAFKKDVRWAEDHLVWFCPVDWDEFDCLHSLYGEVTQQQSTFCKCLEAHGLFCLAEFLRRNECPELRAFTGNVHAFGSSVAGQKTVLNYELGIGFDVLDISTTLLYIEDGRPRSIYAEWHTDNIAVGTKALVAFCGSTTMFNLAEEIEALAAPAAEEVGTVTL